MFKGIRLKNFLLLSSLVFVANSYGQDQVDDFENFAQCKSKDYAVTNFTRTSTEKRKDATEEDPYQHNYVCYDMTCEYNGDTNESDGTISESSAKVKIENKCVIEKVDKTAIFEMSRRGSSGSSGGTSGGFTVYLSVGSGIACLKDESHIDCLKRNRINTSILRCMPNGGNWYCSPDSGGVTINGEVDIAYESEYGFKCVEKKRVWWKLWLGKSYVETDCAKAIGSTRSGSDIFVVRDIDDEVRVRRRGAPGKNTSRVIRTRRDRDDSDRDRRYRLIYDESTGARIRCAINMDDYDCIEEYYRRTGRVGDSDADGCWDCDRRRRRRGGSYSSSGSSDWASIIAATGYAVGNVLTPYLGYRASSKWSNAMYKSNQAWADSCASVQNNFIDGYSSSLDWHAQNELTVGTDYASSYYGNMPGCNGQAMGAFAGMQGFMGSGYGTFGSMYGSAGYSNGFLGAMAGPFARGNYGLGVNVTGGFPGGFGAIGGPGYGIGGAIGFGGNTGFPGVPGYGQFGGFNGGVNGNFGFNSGLNHLYGGVNGNFGLNASVNPQFSSAANGLVPWNTGAGYYMNGGGFNGGYNGGFNGGVNGGAAASLYANQGQVLAGSHFQQQALGDKANRALQNYYSYPYSGASGYGSAAYSPMNVGFGLNAGFGVMI